MRICAGADEEEDDEEEGLEVEEGSLDRIISTALRVRGFDLPSWLYSDCNDKMLYLETDG